MRRALRTASTQSQVGDPDSPGSSQFPEGTRLLEVYEPITTADGRQLIVQFCRRLESVSADSRELLNAFAPFLVGGVLMLQLVNLPLALFLIRRVRSARRKEELLQRAIVASDRERRRLASDLHNGVVQDLAGMSMSLAAVARTADYRGDEAAAARLHEVAAESRRTTRILRHVLVNIYPPNLQRAGLAGALEARSTLAIQQSPGSVRCSCARISTRKRSYPELRPGDGSRVGC